MVGVLQLSCPVKVLCLNFADQRWYFSTLSMNHICRNHILHLHCIPQTLALPFMEQCQRDPYVFWNLQHQTFFFTLWELLDPRIPVPASSVETGSSGSSQYLRYNLFGARTSSADPEKVGQFWAVTQHKVFWKKFPGRKFPLCTKS